MRRTCLAMLLVFLLAACGGDEKKSADPSGKTPEGGGGLETLKPYKGAAKEPDKPKAEPVEVDPMKTFENLTREALASDDAEVQLEALDKVFSATGNKEERARLVVQFLESEDEDVRSMAATAVGKMGVKALAANLRSLLARDKDPLIRKETIVSLYALDGASAVTDLITVVENEDEHYSVRVSACQLLGRSGSDRAIKPLLKILEEDFNEAVRRECVAALAALKAVRAIPLLIEALRDSNALVRTEAAKALGEMKAKKAASPLLDALDLDEEDEVQVLEAISRALGKIAGLDEADMEDFLVTGNHTEAQKKAAVANWQEWWEENKAEYE